MRKTGKEYRDKYISKPTSYSSIKCEYCSKISFQLKWNAKRYIHHFCSRSCSAEYQVLMGTHPKSQHNGVDEI